MCYINYDEWVEYIEKKYCDFSEKRAGGFREWFKDCADNNSRLCEELVFLGNNHEVSLMMATVAKVFDTALYNEETHRAKSRDDSGKQTRYSSGAFYKAIKLAWDNDELQICIPNDVVNSSYYWVEVISALQKRYSIFGSLDDLNEFVFAVGQKSVFSNYGFYMRDLTHVCLAYAIIHGYSLEEERKLLQRAIEAVENAPHKISNEERSAKKTYTKEAKETFEKWFIISENQVMSFKYGDDNETNFINMLTDNRKYIIKNINGFSHWSALKVVLDTLFQNSYNDERVEDIERKFKDRLLIVYGELSDLNDIDITQLCSDIEECSLREYLIKSLSLDKIAQRYQIDIKRANREIEYSTNDKDSPKIRITKENAMDIISVSLRYIYIVALMKQIKNQESCETVMSAIKYINKKLFDAGMRDIDDYLQMGNSAIPIDIPRDFFDGFIVECMYYEEKQELEVVSGFDTFMQYLLNNAETF